MKVSVDQVGSDLAHFSTVGTVLLHAYFTGEMRLLHQAHHDLMIHLVATVVKLGGHSTIAVAPLVLLTYIADLKAQIGVLIFHI